jgi:hypothetical protein
VILEVRRGCPGQEAPSIKIANPSLVMRQPLDEIAADPDPPAPLPRPDAEGAWCKPTD